MDYKCHRYAALKPKTSFYYSDGTGRDAYIVYNSGGAVAPVKKHSMRIPKTLQYWHPRSKHKTPKCLNLNNWPKTWHYPPDGTGRDRYVKINDGGLFSSMMGLRNKTRKFMKNLRSYGKSQMWVARTKVDYFAEGQMRPHTTKQKRVSRLLNHSQRRMSQRLSTPKQRTIYLLKSHLKKMNNKKKKHYFKIRKSQTYRGYPRTSSQHILTNSKCGKDVQRRSRYVQL